MSAKTKPSFPHAPDAPSCDWKSSSKTANASNKNRLLRHKGGYGWSGVRTEKYKNKKGNWSSIIRKVLIGNRGESAKFHLRYFEIAPGGNSSLEKHRHEHIVVCIRGRGEVLIGKKSHSIGYLDTVYIAPDTVHQLKNIYNEPFGFFCIVNSKRDKPKAVKEASG